MRILKTRLLLLVHANSSAMRRGVRVWEKVGHGWASRTVIGESAFVEVPGNPSVAPRQGRRMVVLLAPNHCNGRQQSMFSRCNSTPGGSRQHFSLSLVSVCAVHEHEPRATATCKVEADRPPPQRAERGRVAVNANGVGVPRPEPGRMERCIIRLTFFNPTKFVGIEKCRKLSRSVFTMAMVEK